MSAKNNLKVWATPHPVTKKAATFKELAETAATVIVITYQIGDGEIHQGARTDSPTFADDFERMAAGFQSVPGWDADDEKELRLHLPYFEMLAAKYVS